VINPPATSAHAAELASGKPAGGYRRSLCILSGKDGRALHNLSVSSGDALVLTRAVRPTHSDRAARERTSRTNRPDVKVGILRRALKSQAGQGAIGHSMPLHLRTAKGRRMCSCGLLFRSLSDLLSGEDSHR